MHEALLQLVLGNDLYKMCGCIISDPTTSVLFSCFPCLHTPPTSSPSPSGLPVPPAFPPPWLRKALFAWAQPPSPGIEKGAQPHWPCHQCCSSATVRTYSLLFFKHLNKFQREITNPLLKLVLSKQGDRK